MTIPYDTIRYRTIPYHTIQYRAICKLLSTPSTLLVGEVREPVHGVDGSSAEPPCIPQTAGRQRAWLTC